MSRPVRERAMTDTGSLRAAIAGLKPFIQELHDTDLPRRCTRIEIDLDALEAMSARWRTDCPDRYRRLIRLRRSEIARELHLLTVDALGYFALTEVTVFAGMNEPPPVMAAPIEPLDPTRFAVDESAVRDRLASDLPDS